MDTRLIDFLIRAKQKTCAWKGTETVSSREKSHDLIYRENNFMYYDTYLGEETFPAVPFEKPFDTPKNIEKTAMNIEKDKY